MDGDVAVAIIAGAVAHRHTQGDGHERKLTPNLIGLSAPRSRRSPYCEAHRQTRHFRDAARKPDFRAFSQPTDFASARIEPRRGGEQSATYPHLSSLH